MPVPFNDRAFQDLLYLISGISEHPLVDRQLRT